MQNEPRVLLLIAGRGYCLRKGVVYNGQTVYSMNSRTFAEEDGPVFFSSQEQSFVHQSSSRTAVLCPSAKPGHYTVVKAASPLSETKKLHTQIHHVKDSAYRLVEPFH